LLENKYNKLSITVNMADGKENIDELAQLKTCRASAKAAVTRAITAVDKLMAVDTNLMAVKERMIEFEQVMQDFATAHHEYVGRLTDDTERKEAEEYWRKAVIPANELNDVVGAWIAELEDKDNPDRDDDDENNYDKDNPDRDDDDENNYDKDNDHDEDNETENATDGKLQQEQLHLEQTLQHNAALEAKVQAVKHQKALELETFKLENQELEEKLSLEQQRIRLKLELESRRKHIKEEIERMKAELAQLKMTTETEEDTPTDAAAKVAKVDLRFTHSTPNVLTPKRDLMPPPPKSAQPSLANFTPQYAPHSTLGDVLQQMLDDTRVHQQSLVDSLQRPKIELMSFDGDPLKYWPFVRAFSNAVDSKSDDDGSKLISLIQYCTGKARSNAVL